MKRNLIGLAAVALALVANAAVADNNYTFDDAYWKRAEITVSVQPMQATESRGKYSDVDDFNP
jgi:polyisoprenoid-binding protein YceI